MDFARHIAAELKIKTQQVRNVIQLLDDDNTIPFIARYRKEVTGNLDEEALRSIAERLEYLRSLEERKQQVLQLIDKQGKLTPELAARIQAAGQLQQVDDLYRPFKPKRKTRGSTARKKGLEPLARLLLAQEEKTLSPTQAASTFMAEHSPAVETAEEAVQGAMDIIAEDLADNADLRRMVHDLLWSTGYIEADTPAEEKQLQKLDPQGIYRDYYDFSEKVTRMRPHQVLALNRGEREEALRVRISAPVDRIISRIQKRICKRAESTFTPVVKKAAENAYKRLMAPSLERQIRAELTEVAENHAIQVFSDNLYNLLMQPPIRGTRLIAIDPGYRTGCKLTVIDETGKLLHHQAIYPHPPQNKRQEAIETILAIINEFAIGLIAIGNGTASRETEALVAEVIDRASSDVSYLIVDEAGASVYSASEAARQEFPDLDVTVRGAVSIGRRVLDPLAELAKIDPASIGVGLYQHDVNQNRLAEALDTVVETCVNRVGVEVNTASTALLSYVAGLSPSVARNIVDFRSKHGQIQTRSELLNVPRLGPRTFEQCAGFLRISGGRNPLDATAVHPESYALAESILQSQGFTLEDLQSKAQRRQLQQQLSRLGDEKTGQLADELEAGVPTVRDIIRELCQPGRDPREDMPKPILRKDILTMEDLREGMVLQGTVRNVVDFGAFVDIGVKQDGLVHISEMADSYVSDPRTIVEVGQVLKVKVLHVDLDRQRISLSMRI